MQHRRHAVLDAIMVLAWAACGPSGDTQKPAHPSAPETKPAKAAQAPAAEDGDTASRLADAANVDGDRIVHADATPGDWLSYGRTYGEQRYSPLRDIDTATVNDLGVAWEFRTNTVRGLEA